MGDKLLNSQAGSGWIQPFGPNSEPEFLGTCVEIDAISEPLGTRDLTSHTNEDGIDEPAGERIGPPDKITGTISVQMESVRNALDKLPGYCSDAVLHIHSKSCGTRSTEFDDFDVGFSYRKFRPESLSRDGLIKLRGNVQHPKTDRPFSAWYPSLQNVKIIGSRRATVETMALNSVLVNHDTQCYDCGPVRKVGDVGIAVADAGVGVAANVLLLAAGVWAATAADPFAINRNIQSAAYVILPGGVRRYIVAMEAPAGAQGMIAFTDDLGVSWTTVNVGGAAAGHGAVFGRALFAKNSREVWLAGAGGYIYKSEDGGVTVTAKDSGGIHVGNYMAIKFYNSKYGVAVGAAGIVALTRDGGENWYAGAVPVAETLNTVEILDDKHLWVGTAAGKMYFSNDFGSSWTRRTGFPYDGIGQIREIRFMNFLTGFALQNSAAPVGRLLRTTNGGYSWIEVDDGLPANSGMNAFDMLELNELVAVGEPQGGLAMIAQVAE